MKRGIVRVASKRATSADAPCFPGLAARLAALAALLVTLETSLSPAAERAPAANLIPWPRSVKFGGGSLVIGKGSRIVAGTPELSPLAEVLSQDIHMATALRLQVGSGRGGSGDIVLRLDPQVAGGEAYRLAVGPRGALVEARTYRGAAWGTSTFLQALKLGKPKQSELTVPHMTVEDQPVAKYRGLLIDVARQWHPVETLRPIVQMCRLYKVNYIQLHLNDQQSTVFPSKAFPKLRTVSKGKRRHYTWEELTGLVRYADERGVTFVPELEGPGHHSGNLRGLWGRKGTSCLDMGSEKTYEGLGVLFGEICDVFNSSPYFHIGADECSLGGVGNSEEEKAFMAKHGLEGRGGLYNYYIKRVNEIVKSYGKQTICWEGFHGGGGGGVEIPRDVIVMPFESAYNTASNLVRHGFTVINTAWKPLYVVGGRKWPAWYIYERWNLWLWEHHVNRRCHIQLKRTDPVLGAQMCAWEQPASRELPSTRERIHAMSERIWSPEAGRTYADFAARAEKTDALLDRLLGVASIRAEGLLSEGAFCDPITVSMSALPVGTIRYTIDGSEPTAESPEYTAPFALGAGETRHERLFYNRRIGRHMAEGDVVRAKARLFGPGGKPLSDVTAERTYYRFVPRARYRVYESQQLLFPDMGPYSSMPAETERGLRFEDAAFVRKWRFASHTEPWRDHKSFVEMNAMKRRAVEASAASAALVASERDFVDFRSRFPAGKRENVVGYVLRTIRCAGPRRVRILAGSDDALRIWLNGKLVVQALALRGARRDTETAAAELGRGENRLLVEVSQFRRGWGLYLRLTDENKRPLGLTEGGELRDGGGVTYLKPVSTGVWPYLEAGFPGGAPLGAAVVSTGTIRLPADGRYTFTYHRGQGQILIGDRMVFDATRKIQTGEKDKRGRPVTKGHAEAVVLRKGDYPIRLNFWGGGPLGSTVHYAAELEAAGGAVAAGKTSGSVRDLLLPLPGYEQKQ